MKKVMTIAGSDSSGGAGIQADLKVFELLEVYGMSALTSIVSMEPQTWNHLVHVIDLEVIEEQIKTIFSIGVDAVKTGMLPSVTLIEMLAREIKKNNFANLVVDPVMVCKGTDTTVNVDTAEAFGKFLMPLATVVTPNLYEAGQLANMTNAIGSINDMKEAAHIIYSKGAKSVYIKGRNIISNAEEVAFDLFYDGTNFYSLKSAHISTDYTHGAGCTLAAAITANLAKNLPLQTAVMEAKKFVATAINYGWKLNSFVGAVKHGAAIKSESINVDVAKI